MKLKDFKKLNEGWDRWRLTEGKLQYSVSNTGYGDVYEFFDENGEETEQTLGMMVLDLADAGVGGWAPEEQIDRMMAVNADPNKNQGGMQKWDSSVFEDYYGADNQKILQAWAKMNNMELEQMPEAEDEYEDDGEYDFESYYSESKKRNKIHESRMGDLHIQIQDALSEIMQQYGVGLEDIEGVIGDMMSDQEEPQPYDAEADEHYEWRHQSDQDLRERIRKAVVRKLRENRKK